MTDAQRVKWTTLRLAGMHPAWCNFWTKDTQAMDWAVEEIQKHRDFEEFKRHPREGQYLGHFERHPRSYGP